jgi:hypothetical protein
MMMRSQPYIADRASASPRANGDQLPVLDLYERYRDGEMFLTGAFGGVKIFIYPIKGADPDDRCWRVYLAPRLAGIDKDRTKPTSQTKPAPTGWDAVRERQSLKKTLAAVGMAAPHYSPDELQRDLGFDLEDDPL